MEDLNEYDVGQPMNEPMQHWQYIKIEQLLSNAILTDEQKDGYLLCLDCKLSYLEAEGIIEELRGVQMDSVNLARSGKLNQIDLGKALTKLVNMPNT